MPLPAARRLHEPNAVRGEGKAGPARHRRRTVLSAGIVAPGLSKRLPPLSILDLAPIVEGGTVSDALRNSLDLAQHAERWGYERFWLAEHHNAAGHRERCDRRRDRARRRRHEHDSCRRRRDHAAEPRAARHRRAVRHSRCSPSGTDRPRSRPRTRHRPADDARAAPRSHELRHVPAGRPRAAGAARRPAAGAGSAGDPGHGDARSALDARLEPLRSAACGGARPSVLVRVALRARRAAAGAGGLSRAIRALGAAAAAVRDGGRERDRGRRRRRGAPSFHVLAADVHEHLPRSPRTAAAADRRHRGRTGHPRSG